MIYVSQTTISQRVKNLIKLFESISKTSIKSAEWNKNIVDESNGYLQYITKDILCSPCYMGSGCETMDCINLITPSVVYNEINKFVKQF